MSQTKEYRERKLKRYGKVPGYIAFINFWAPVIAVLFTFTIFTTLTNQTVIALPFIIDIIIAATAWAATIIGRDADKSAWWSCMIFVTCYTGLQILQIIQTFLSQSSIPNQPTQNNAFMESFNQIIKAVSAFGLVIQIIVLVGCIFYILTFLKHKKFFFSSLKSLKVQNGFDSLDRNTPPAQSKSNEEYIEIAVAGVTYSNEKESRQSILKQIKFREGVFKDGIVQISTNVSEYKGEPCIAILVNDLQIGFIPKEKVPYFIENLKRMEITDFEVVGGGYTEDGEPLKYGARITFRLKVSNLDT